MINDVLFSFVGAQDPFALKRGARENGPILTLCRERTFHRIVLLHTGDDESRHRADQTGTELLSFTTQQPRLEKVPLTIADPTHHESIIKALRNWWDRFKKEGNEEYYISISSGTPAMHVCWLMLAAADEIHANVLYVRNPLYVGEGQPLIAEINPRAPEFPAIQSRASLAEVTVGGTETAALARECGLLGESPVFRKALATASRYGTYDYPVLLLGETGTGKERFARFIHDAGKRSRGPFVPINCGALPATLIESELFGHMKGSFTGADADKKGAFEEANGGTLFLDEIGDMPAEMQVKLLRVLQEHKIRPIGGKEKSVDVRIIAATHRDLEKSQSQGGFRADLYNRLNVLPLSLPPLRERREDILPLALSFLAKANQSYDSQKKLSSSAIDRLMGYGWPGNVRELENIIKLAFVLADGVLIETEHIRLAGPRDDDDSLPALHHGFSLEAHLEKVRSRLYADALRRSGDNLSEAGRLLGVSPEAVRKAKAKLSS